MNEVVLRPDSASEQTISVRWMPGTRVWESRGHRGHGWLGAGIGFVVGAGAAALIVASSELEGPPPGIVSFPLAGVFMGALLGSGIKSERWGEIRER